MKCLKDILWYEKPRCFFDVNTWKKMQVDNWLEKSWTCWMGMCYAITRQWCSNLLISMRKRSGSCENGCTLRCSQKWPWGWWKCWRKRYTKVCYASGCHWQEQEQWGLKKASDRITNGCESIWKGSVMFSPKETLGLNEVLSGSCDFLTRVVILKIRSALKCFCLQR